MISLLDIVLSPLVKNYKKCHLPKILILKLQMTQQSDEWETDNLYVSMSDKDNLSTTLHANKAFGQG